MATGPRWQDPIGLETISSIVRTIIPTWRDGLHPVQLELVSAILGGVDILCCTATGDGKSAAFAVPGLVLVDYNAHPDAYPAGFPTRKRPIGVVITPTKGLASNIVLFPPRFTFRAHSFLGFRTVKIERFRFLILPRNSERSTKGWNSIGRSNKGMY